MRSNNTAETAKSATEWTVDSSKAFREIGNVSSGTMRPQDLIPTLLDVLKDFDADAHGDLLGDIPPNAFLDDDHWYWNLENGDFSSTLLIDLFDALDEHSPDYCAFGAHIGDGSDYGFWPDIESLEENSSGRYRCIQKFSDLSEIPEDMSGDVLDINGNPADVRSHVMLVNDHGNVTLFSIDHANHKLIECWAIV